MPLTLDSDRRMSLPCGYFSRGGIYYLELISNKKDNLLSDDDYEGNNSSDSFSKRDVSGIAKRVEREVVTIDESQVNSESSARNAMVTETSDSVVKSWKFEVLWPTASLDVTPEQIQTYPERQVTAIIEFPNVVCTPVETGTDFWLELLYCGHSSGGAVLCDGKNTSSNAHVLYSEQVRRLETPFQ